MLVLTLLLFCLVEFNALGSVNLKKAGVNVKEQSHSNRGGVVLRHYGQVNRTFVSYQMTNDDVLSENVPQLFGMRVEYLKFTGSMCKPACDVNVESPYFPYDGEQHFLSDFIAKTVETMPLVSMPRKQATAILMKSVLMQCIPGDVVETGVFTGGSAAVIMKVLLELDKCKRKFYVFDSFAGLPDATPKDTFGQSNVGKSGLFSTTYDAFQNNLKAMNVWNENILVVSKGWFNETVSISPVQRIAFLRLDGDMYTSTKDAIVGLYPKLVSGGYIYVDDYGSFNGCKVAIDEYRTEHRIYETMHFIYEPSGRFEAVWWQKA